MKAAEVIAKKASEVGIPTAKLARRIGMNSELLRRSFLGIRKLQADEFVSLCKELELKLTDFN